MPTQRQSVQNFGQTLQMLLQVLAQDIDRGRFQQGLAGASQPILPPQLAQQAQAVDAMGPIPVGPRDLGQAPVRQVQSTPAQIPDPLQALAMLLSQDPSMSANPFFGQAVQTQGTLNQLSRPTYSQESPFNRTVRTSPSGQRDVISEPTAMTTTGMTELQKHQRERDAIAAQNPNDPRLPEYDNVIKKLQFGTGIQWQADTDASGKEVRSVEGGITMMREKAFDPRTGEWIYRFKKVDDQSRVPPNIQAVRIQLVDRFNANPQVRKVVQMVTSANTIRDLIDSNNPIADASIPTFMARASGEVGALSEADKAPFGGSRALIERIEAVANLAAEGKLTPENRVFVRNLADVLVRSGNSNIQAQARQFSRQYSKAVPELKETDIYNMVFPSEINFDGGQTSGIGGDNEDFNQWLKKQGK